MSNDAAQWVLVGTYLAWSIGLYTWKYRTKKPFPAWADIPSIVFCALSAGIQYRAQRYAVAVILLVAFFVDKELRKRDDTRKQNFR